MTDVAPVSPELGLLCHCDLASDAELAAFIGATPSFDWECFQKLVSFNAMGGMVHARLSSVAAGMLPPFLADYLSDRHRHHGIVYLAHESETARLVDRLDRAGISSVVLKGVAVAQLLYQPHVNRRYSSDIDILVSLDSFLEADRVLAAAGYRRQWPEGDMPQRGKDMIFHLTHALSYVHSRSGLCVELHHRLTANPFWLPATDKQIFGETVEIPLPQGTIRGLDGAVLIGYLAWHSLGHHDEYRVKWFSDFVRTLLRADPSEYPDLLRRCEAFEASRALSLAGAVADRLYGPSLIGDRLSLEGVVPFSGDVERIIAVMERAEAAPIHRNLMRLPAELGYVRFSNRLASDRQARTFQVLRELSDPRDALTLGLGVRWSWLYAVAGPFLALTRYFYRGLNRSSAELKGKL